MHAAPRLEPPATPANAAQESLRLRDGDHPGGDARAPGLWGFVAAAGAGGRGAGPVIRVRGGEVYLGERLSAAWGWGQDPHHLPHLCTYRTTYLMR